MSIFRVSSSHAGAPRGAHSGRTCIQAEPMQGVACYGFGYGMGTIELSVANLVACGDVEEAVSRGAQPQRTKARAHRRVRWWRTWSGPQSSPSAQALYLSLVLQPFPSRIVGSEEADGGGGTCGEP